MLLEKEHHDLNYLIETFLLSTTASVALIPIHKLILRDHRYTLHAVLVYSSAFGVLDCVYPLSDGQAELFWVAGYPPQGRRLPIPVLTGHDV